MLKSDGDGNPEKPVLKEAFEAVLKALTDQTPETQVRVLHAAAIIFGLEEALRERLGDS